MNAIANTFSLSSLGQEQAKKFMMAVFAMAVAALLLAAPEAAQAGSNGTEFNDVWEKLSDWIEGSLGRVVVGSMILVGVVMGIARQSIMAFAIGIGGGIGLAATPKLVDNLLSATLTTAAQATEAISNGLGAGLL